MEHTDIQKAEDIFLAFLKSRKMRRTPERLAILAEVVATGAHFNVEDIYSALDAKGYHVSRATVYSTVDLLCQCGIVRRLLFDVHQSWYELTGRNHLHLVCTACGRVREADSPQALDGLASLRPGGFSVAYSSATLYGLCSRCARKVRKSASLSAGKEKS